MWFEKTKTTHVHLYLRIEVFIYNYSSELSLGFVAFYENGEWVWSESEYDLNGLEDMNLLKDKAIVEWMNRPARKEFRSKTHRWFN